LLVVLYAAFLGLLLASYVSPMQEIFRSRAEIPVLENRLHETQVNNAAQERLIQELNTPEGIERAARERYGMIRPGETIYIIPDEDGE
jgi:cell division protein FtsB